jgi:hypothetical protein
MYGYCVGQGCKYVPLRLSLLVSVLLHLLCTLHMHPFSLQPFLQTSQAILLLYSPIVTHPHHVDLLHICMLALSAAAEFHSSNSSPSFDEQQDSSSRSSGKCPFLAALPTPPPAQNAFWRRLQQLFSPAEYQQEALGPHSMVAAPKQVR